MKSIITLFILFISVSVFARGGGDSGGGPTLKFKVALDATRIEIGNILLTKVAIRENLYKSLDLEDRQEIRGRHESEVMVKVVIKYKIPEVKCIERENRMDRCYNGFATKYKSVLFKTDLFPANTIQKLDSRGLFARKKPYVALAKENLSVEVVEGEESQLVTVEVF